MLFLHNWENKFSISVSFETNIFQSFLRSEQRRQLRTFPILEMKKNFLLVAGDAREFLSRNYEEVIIPIDIENFGGVRGAAGQKKVTASTSISDFWFLNNLSEAYIIDDDENYEKITSIAGSVINLDGDLDGTSNTFYVAVECFTKNINLEYLNGNILRVNAIFLSI